MEVEMRADNGATRPRSFAASYVVSQKMRDDKRAENSATSPVPSYDAIEQAHEYGHDQDSRYRV
jgi:hypothetical protein